MARLLPCPAFPWLVKSPHGITDGGGMAVFRQHLYLCRMWRNSGCSGMDSRLVLGSRAAAGHSEEAGKADCGGGSAKGLRTLLKYRPSSQEASIARTLLGTTPVSRIRQDDGKTTESEKCTKDSDRMCDPQATPYQM